jgi:uncharacterized protein (TIGR00369 family)
VIDDRIRASFDEQGFMRLLGASLHEASGGICVIEIAGRDDLKQQHGFVHAGVIGAVADTASGYAALSLWPEGSGVLTVEYKVNLVAPAVSPVLRARGEVVRGGKNVTVCESRVANVADDGGETICAIALVTLLRR